MHLNKRAVSPLIATVLLVMIVVSIGAAVMVVIQGLSEEGLQSIEAQKDLLQCGTDVNVKIEKLGTTSRMCLQQPSTAPYRGSLAVMMTNDGFQDISGFRVTLIGDDGFNTSTYDSTPLSKGETKVYRFAFGGVATDSSRIRKLAVNPRVPGRDIVTCTEPSLEFNEDFIGLMQNCSAPGITWDDNIINETVTG